MPDDPGRLPHDPSAERAVLGAVLVDQVQLDGIREVLGPTDFHDRRHEAIFAAFCALDDETGERRIDPLTVRDELRRAGKLASVGGLTYVTELFDGVARSSNAVDYARVVRRHAISRQLHQVGRRLLTESLRDDPREVLTAASENLSSIAEHTFEARPAALATELAHIVEEAQRERKAMRGISTGLPDLDRIMGGLRDTDLVLVGGRPGDGKTSLGLQFALAAGLARRRVLIFSLEMPRRQIALRLICSQARVDSKELDRPGRLSRADRQRLAAALPVVSGMQLFVDDSNVNPTELRSKARQLSREGDEEKNLDLIVVDYLQLMQVSSAGSRRFENRNLEVAEISRSLKLMAKELEVPVLALSQLNRSPAKRDLARPRLADLRESGALEQDADIVLLIHRGRMKRRSRRRDEEAEEDGPPVRTVIVAKNRNGPTGHVEFAWLDTYTRFETMVAVRETEAYGGYDASDIPPTPGF